MQVGVLQVSGLGLELGVAPAPLEGGEGAGTVEEAGMAEEAA